PQSQWPIAALSAPATRRGRQVPCPRPSRHRRTPVRTPPRSATTGNDSRPAESFTVGERDERAETKNRSRADRAGALDGRPRPGVAAPARGLAAARSLTAPAAGGRERSAGAIAEQGARP